MVNTNEMKQLLTHEMIALQNIRILIQSNKESESFNIIDFVLCNVLKIYKMLFDECKFLNHFHSQLHDFIKTANNGFFFKY